MSEQGCPHGLLVPGLPCRYCLQEQAAAEKKLQQIDTLVTEIKNLEGERPDAAPPKVLVLCAGCGRPESNERDCGCPAGTITVTKKEG